ncbi:MAG: tetratricopeptide repeat protein [Deltaproteobacteria bacterium]|nr:tetratricopeptide repeat protein [Deltaproteobacteria bacterium]
MNEKQDPKKVNERINAIFNLVSSANNNILRGSLDSAMKDLIKVLKLYAGLQTLKKEKDLLEERFFELETKLANHPKFANTYGPVSFVKGDHKMAIDFLTQLVNLEPEPLEDKIQRFQTLLNDERFKEATVLAQEILDDPNAELKHFVAVGDIYLKAELWEDAQHIYRSAGKRYPNSIHILNRMAISLRKNGQFEESLAYYREVSRLAPRDEGVYYNVAVAFIEWGRKEKAVQALEKALEIKPDFEAASKLLIKLQANAHGGTA